MKSLEEGSDIHDPKAGAHRAKSEQEEKLTTSSEPRHQNETFLEPPHEGVKVNRHRKGFYSQPSGYLVTY